MAFEHEELNRRREQRAKERAARARRTLALRIGMAVTAITLICCALAVLIARGILLPDPEVPSTTLPPETTQAVVHQPDTVIHFVAGGDVNVTDKTVASGTSINGYDYTEVFLDIAAVLADADLSAVNFEGNLVGSPYGSSTHSAPQALMDALSAAGVDLIQAANSQSIANGILGLRSTLQGIREAGMEPVGAYADSQEFQDAGGYLLYQVSGIRIAIVAFTKGMDGMGLPEGSEDCVNVLYTDYNSTYQKVDTSGITAVLQAAAAAEPDITIALLHWGSEYNNTISTTQEKIRDLMLSNGVDIIVGTHSHYVQRIDYDEAAGTLVAYSLGDLLGNAEESGTDYSILLDVEITKNGDTGVTTVTGYSYTPIYILDQSAVGLGMRVLRIEQGIAAYEGNSIMGISEEAYQGMQNALSKISARLDTES